MIILQTEAAEGIVKCQRLSSVSVCINAPLRSQREFMKGRGNYLICKIQLSCNTRDYASYMYCLNTQCISDNRIVFELYCAFVLLLSRKKPFCDKLYEAIPPPNA